MSDYSWSENRGAGQLHSNHPEVDGCYAAFFTRHRYRWSEKDAA